MTISIQRLCDDCHHSEFSFDPDIKLTCTLARPVLFVLPNDNEELSTRRCGWIFAGRFLDAVKTVREFCNRYQTIFVTKPVVQELERQQQQQEQERKPPKPLKGAWWTTPRFQHNPLKDRRS